METMIVKINGKERTVNFKSVFTRKMDREYNAMMFKNVNASLIAGGAKDISINPMDIQLANDFLIFALSDLTPAEVDDLSVEEYQKVLEVVNKIKTPPPKQSQAS